MEAYRRGLNQVSAVAERHRELATVVSRASRWTGSFRVVTDAVADDGSPLYTYPLRRHADELERIEQALLRAGHEWIQSLGDAKAAAGLLTPAPPPPLTGLSCSLIPASLVGYRPHYGEGGGYVLALRPDGRHFANSRDAWAAEIADAAYFLSAAEIRTDGLARYHTGVTSLLDHAYLSVREGYADAVAATYGPAWIKFGPRPNGGLMLWMKALIDVGFDASECELVLRGLETAFPEAVARCRAAADFWMLDSIR